MENFSTCKRDALIEELSKKKFDVLIFGGGITGVGIALDAVTRGLDVALIEQKDFASGTSSRSTKLIHGGLRYLNQLQFCFVSKLGRERRIIQSIAQNNVIPTPVLLPIYKRGLLKKTRSAFGLRVYDYLANVKKEYKSRWINRDELIKRYSILETDKLRGAFLYYEFKTNDGRLVIEALKKSAEHGALCLNYAEPCELLMNNDYVSGATIKDLKKEIKFDIDAKMVINATGVWCQKFMQQFNLKLPKDLYPTKGVHIALTKEKVPINEAFYIDTEDKRLIFVIPRQKHVYVGTTDTKYDSDYRKPTVTKKEAEYLLSAVNLKFPKLDIKYEDIVSCWAGIRPLIKDKRINPGEISRRDELFLAENGLLTITGGKLTGYRLMAEKVVDNVLVYLNKDDVKSKTAHIKLSGSEWDTLFAKGQLIEQADHAFDEAKQTGITPEEFKTLFYRYGKNIQIITEKAYEIRSNESNPETIWLKAELWYCVNYEMLNDLADFYMIRTEMVLFDFQKMEKQKTEALNYLSELLNWSENEKENARNKLEKDWKNYKTPME